jgi:hypothetical protein
MEMVGRVCRWLSKAREEEILELGRAKWCASGRDVVAFEKPICNLEKRLGGSRFEFLRSRP